MRPSLLAMFLILAVPAVVGATVYHLEPNGSGVFPSIQAAVDACASGDTILLADGVYKGAGNHDILIRRKVLHLLSESGDPSRCVIDCQGESRGLDFHDGPDIPSWPEMAVIDGIGIRNTGGWAIGAVFTQLLIRNCIIEDSKGGLNLSWSSFELTGCVIRNNRAWRGGGVKLIETDLLATDCVFYRNHADSDGGAIYSGPKGDFTLVRCTFSENDAASGAVIHCESTSQQELDCCIVSYSEEGAAIWKDGQGTITLGCCNLFGNAGGDWTGAVAEQRYLRGNFSVDPQFCGVLGSGNLYLQSDSPCAPAANDCGLVGALPVGCQATATAELSWSAVKALY